MANLNLEEIRSATEQLTSQQKLALADILLSESGMTDAIDAAWREELKKRGQRLRAGKTETITLAEFAARHEAHRSVG